MSSHLFVPLVQIFIFFVYSPKVVIVQTSITSGSYAPAYHSDENAMHIFTNEEYSLTLTLKLARHVKQ
jgi:hypothetical protein